MRPPVLRLHTEELITANLTLPPLGRVTLLYESPPCQAFSKGFKARLPFRPKRLFPDDVQ